jgi:hypothetical protein
VSEAATYSDDAPVTIAEAAKAFRCTGRTLRNDIELAGVRPVGSRLVSKPTKLYRFGDLRALREAARPQVKGYAAFARWARKKEQS